MPFVQAKCPECGGMLAVDADKKAANCQFCGEAFIVKEAINNYNTYNTTNYNTTHQYGDGAVVNVYEDKSKDFVIEAGVLKEYHGESVDVVLPENIKSIALECFVEKNGNVLMGKPIETIDIGNNNIDEYSLFHSLICCRNLRSVEVSLDNTNYTCEDGILYNKDKTDIIFIPKAYPRENFTVKSSILKISYYIKNNLDNFTHLNYNDVDFMNLNCQDFKLIELAQKINLPYRITNHSFVDDQCKYCGSYNVVSENIYKSGYGYPSERFRLSVISNNKVVLTCNHISDIDDYFKFNSYKYENIIPDKCKTLIIGNLNISNSKNYATIENIQRLINSCSIVEKVIIDSPTYEYFGDKKRDALSNVSFEKFVNLKEVIINESIINCPKFENCSKLEKVKLPSTIKTIPSNCFKNCSNLKDIYLSENIEEIREYAFQNCHSLEKINLSKNLKHVYSYAFAGCEKLIDIQIPETITQIIQKEIKSIVNASDYDTRHRESVYEYAFSDFWKKQNKCQKCGGEFKKTLLGKSYCKNCRNYKNY